MEPLEFSVPYNNDIGLLNEIFKIKNLNNNRIREIYLSGPREYNGSGRIMSEISLDEFQQVVKRIHAEGIRVNLVLNSTCEGIEWYSQKSVNRIMEYLRIIHEDYMVEAVTIANPLYLWEARKRFKDLEICASVLSDIDCIQRAEIFSDAHPEIITPDVNINRNLTLLKEIKTISGARLKLLVNEGCLYKCPFRKFHFNLSSHISKETNKGEGSDISFGKFFGACTSVIEKDESQILKSCWIRPEDLRKYAQITNYFKIVDRSQPSETIIRATKAYLNESWNGDLLDIVSGGSKRFGLIFGAYVDNQKLTETDFFRKVTSCDHLCHTCTYCPTLAKTAIRTKIVTSNKLVDLGMNKAVANEIERQTLPKG